MAKGRTSSLPGLEGPKVLELTLVERLYVQRAIAGLLASLERSRAKELPGTEIYDLRGRELEAVTAISRRLQSS